MNVFAELTCAVFVGVLIMVGSGLRD